MTRIDGHGNLKGKRGVCADASQLLQTDSDALPIMKTICMSLFRQIPDLLYVLYAWPSSNAVLLN